MSDHLPIRLLTIAGFDGSGGAGIQADLKTFSALGCYGMSALTALPIQNTLGVRKCYELPDACILEQLEAIFDDLPPSAIKIGMLSRKAVIQQVSAFLAQHAKGIPIVLDPVITAKSGHALLHENAIEALKHELFPLATVVTPNIAEVETLCRQKTHTSAELGERAKHLLSFGSKAVLIKGGHLENEPANDLLVFQSGEQCWLEGKRIATKNTHGTGCTFSAAIASFLGHGLDLQTACLRAKKYVSKAIEAAKEMVIGHGHGPVHHFFNIWPLLEEQTARGGFAKRAWSGIEEIFQRILDLPFVRELGEGTLAQERFLFYLRQDAHYLVEFARAITLIAARCNQAEHISLFISFAEGALKERERLHLALCEPVDQRLVPSPAAVAYTQYLLSQAALAPVPVAVAAVLPCFWIYLEVGKHLNQLAESHNPYARWIRTYASPEFEQAVQRVLDIFERLAVDASPSVRDAMLANFKTSSQLEWHFWDDAYSMRRLGEAEAKVSPLLKTADMAHRVMSYGS